MPVSLSLPSSLFLSFSLLFSSSPLLLSLLIFSLCFPLTLYTSKHTHFTHPSLLTKRIRQATKPSHVQAIVTFFFFFYSLPFPSLPISSHSISLFLNCFFSLQTPDPFPSLLHFYIQTHTLNLTHTHLYTSTQQPHLITPSFRAQPTSTSILNLQRSFKMLDRPFSDVCSTVSCWALIFSVILPSMQVMGVKVTSLDASPTATTSNPQQQHYHLQKHSHQLQQQLMLKTSIFSLTVYLDPTTIQQTLSPMTFLSDPSPSSSNNKNSDSSSSPSSPKSYLVQNGSWKEQQDPQLPQPQLNQRSPVIGQDVNPPPPVRGFSSSSSYRKRVRGGHSRTALIDQGSVWSRSSLLPPVESDTDNHDATAARREEEGEEGRIGLGISKGPRRLSRHRYPHALIHRLYNNNNRPLREGGSSRRMAIMPKTTAKSTTTRRRIEAKKRPSRLQQLLLLSQQEHDINETFLWNAINHNNNHHQQKQQRQIRNDPPSRGDDLSYYSTHRDLAEMMNFILDDEELSEHFLANNMLQSASSSNDDNHLDDSPTFEAKQQQQQQHHQQPTPAPTSSSSSSSFVSPSLSEWTQNDIDMARALWDYWEELDAMDLIQAQLESQLVDEGDVNQEDINNIGHKTHYPRQNHLRQRPEHQLFRGALWNGKVKALAKDDTSNMSSPLEWMQDGISVRPPSSTPELFSSFLFLSPILFFNVWYAFLNIG